MKFNELTFVNHGGISKQARVDFPNGYGASIVIGSFTYGGDAGLYELAVFKNGGICYDSGITSDVMGWLTPDEVESYLRKIEALPGPGEPVQLMLPFDEVSE